MTAAALRALRERYPDKDLVFDEGGSLIAVADKAKPPAGQSFR
jgi:hypothetical protein